MEDLAGVSKKVSFRVLSNLFSILKEIIRYVVLNACNSEKLAQAFAEHIDCVIGISTVVGDEAAINFAAAFSRALGYGRDVKTAFDLGISQRDLVILDEQGTAKVVRVNSPTNIMFVCEEEFNKGSIAKNIYTAYLFRLTMIFDFSGFIIYSMVRQLWLRLTDRQRLACFDVCVLTN